jgi:chromosome segregation ATPase
MQKQIEGLQVQVDGSYKLASETKSHYVCSHEEMWQEINKLRGKFAYLEEQVNVLHNVLRMPDGKILQLDSRISALEEDDDATTDALSEIEQNYAGLYHDTSALEEIQKGQADKIQRLTDEIAILYRRMSERNKQARVVDYCINCGSPE